jgi:hypothetical protein
LPVLVSVFKRFPRSLPDKFGVLGRAQQRLFDAFCSLFPANFCEGLLELRAFYV